jgi:L-threonylcarbamoyladenylate synthase
METKILIWENSKLVQTLMGGGVVVMPTDTIYGIVGKAENKETVERIYKVRLRAPEKPCIILIGDLSEIKKFDIEITNEQENEILNIGDRPTSFILDCNKEEFSYLHRGTNTLAFRIPKQNDLKLLLRSTGPLVAPSANLEGQMPSKNIQQAKEYFGDKVDLYVDGGEVIATASKIIRLLRDGSVEVIRA